MITSNSSATAQSRLFHCLKFTILLIGLGWLCAGCNKTAQGSSDTVVMPAKEAAFVMDETTGVKLAEPGIWKTEADRIVNELIEKGQLQTIAVGKFRTHVHVVLPPAASVAGLGSIFTVKSESAIPLNTQLVINLVARGPGGPIESISVMYHTHGERTAPSLEPTLWNPQSSCGACSVGFFVYEADKVDRAHQ